MEVCVVSHITISFHRKPIMIGLHHCRFCFKIGSDVSAPYKKEPGTNTRTHPHFTLISQFHVLSLLTLFTLRGHGSWIFHCRYINVLHSHIVAIYICIIDLYLFSLRHFTWHILYNAIYIFLFIFLEFY